MMKVTKVMGMVQCKSTVLGGQTQQETANKATGQDNVPFDEVCGLYKRDKKHKWDHEEFKEQGKLY